MTLTSHNGPVYSTAWSSDGQQIVTGSYDQTVQVWEANTGQELLTLAGHESWVMSAAWSPDGQRIVTGSRSYSQGVGG